MDNFPSIDIVRFHPSTKNGEYKMGAICYFDKMLPSIKQESNEPNPKRQLEIFTYEYKLWLRVGQINHKNSGIERYTVELSKDDAIELIKGIKAGMHYFGEDI